MSEYIPGENTWKADAPTGGYNWKCHASVGPRDVDLVPRHCSRLRVRIQRRELASADPFPPILDDNMDQLQQQHHVEDVGRILLQTQEQLRLMREQMAAAASTSTPSTPTRFSQSAQPDVDAFQEILQRAELEIRAKAELVLNGLVNTSSQAAATLSTLPAVGNNSPTTRKQNIGSFMARRNSRDNNESDIDYFRSVSPSCER